MQIKKTILHTLCVSVALTCMYSQVLAEEDYYKLLGVDRSASTKDIKRAFRKLAKQYHPDRNKAKNAEQTFRKIAQAYEILSDTNKRAQYDRYGHAAFKDGADGQHQEGPSFDMHDFFKHFDMYNDAGGQRQEGDSFHQGFDFGSSFGSFNFGSLFDDGEENNDGQANGNHFGSFDSFFGSDEMMSGSHFSSYSESHSQNCRTVTKRQGNTVITHTECH